MDSEGFERAAKRVAQRQGRPDGIGALGEKTVHAVLKEYYGESGQIEVPLCGFVADIVRDGSVIEIQTRGFDRLRPKLEAMLPQMKVTVVHPIARVKWIFWIDEENGLVSKKRRSPKVGTPFEAFRELYRIKRHLSHPNFALKLVMLDLEEYRSLCDSGADRKRGARRFDRIPLALGEEIDIEGPEDWAKLVPGGLPGLFTSRDFGRAARVSLSGAQTALNVLKYVGAVKPMGKTGNSILYSAGGAKGATRP